MTKTMVHNDFVSISDLDLKAAGATIWWKLRDTTTRAKLTEALQEVGVPEARWLIPDEPSAERCLRRSVKELRQFRRLIRPLKGQKGWALVSEDATDDNLVHETDVIIRLTEGDGVSWQPTFEGRQRISRAEMEQMESMVNDSFEEHFSTVNAGDMSAWLIRQVQTLNAVTLRDGGGVYFIPPEHVLHWEALGEVLKLLGESRAYSMRAMRASNVVEAVFDSLVDEATVMTDAIRFKMAEDVLGVRAMHNRIATCESFMEKVKRYGGFLDANMDRVLAEVESMKVDLSAAILAVDEEDEG